MRKSVFLFLCFSLMFAVRAHAKVVMPDACGDDNVEFKVEAVDDHSVPLTAEAGKALLVIVELGTSKHFDLTTRYGLDGQWVGATHTDSYFVVQITPGEHHLCASPQKHFGFNDKMREQLVSVTPFTAEAGKVYFFGSKESTTGTPGHQVYVPPAAGSNGAGHYSSSGGSQQLNVDYYFMNEDEGRYRVKAGKLAKANKK